MTSRALPGFTDAQIRSILRVFNSHTSDRHPLLSVSEFPIALRNLGIIPSQAELTEMLKEIPDGRIDVNHFLLVVYHFVRAADSPQDLLRAFASFDEDRDGKIPVSVVTDVLRNLRRPLPDERIEQITENLGGTGEIDIEELVRELRPE